MVNNFNPRRILLVVAYSILASIFCYVSVSALLLFINQPCPYGISFANALLNALVWDLGFFCPWLMNIISFFLWKDCWKLRLAEQITGALCIPLALCCIFFSSYSWKDSRDNAFEPVETIAVSPCVRVIAYRTDGGATTDYGITVQEEFSLLPGFALTKKLVSRYHASDVAFTLDGAHTLRCVFSGSDRLTDKEVTVAL